MARAGFTAIASGQIVFGKDGRWYCDGEPITNPAICRLYSRSLQVDSEGRARLELGEDRARVVLEDTPWVVTGVEGAPETGFAVALNDGSRELLDATTLTVGAGHVLYCRVKGGRHRARFLRPAYYALMRHVETDAAGRAVLPVRGRRVPIGGPGA
ncbi:MAG TPA: hypothetical protein VKW76_12660 [Candidatus Binatia bacterium]|nr:hypothetical protein [Candidatus Binatia bacterium]